MKPSQLYIRFTDYQITSKKVFNGTFVAISALFVLIILSEFIVDIKSITLFHLTPFFILYPIASLLLFYKKNKTLISILVSLSIFLSIEFIFYENPKIFHIINYWFAFIPIVALLMQGLKQSFLWVIIIFLAIIGNSLYFGKVIGEQYSIDFYKNSFIISGIIFLISLISVNYLMYFLIGNAYSKMKDKAAEFESVKEINEVKSQKLEKYHENIIELSQNDQLLSGSLENLFEKVCISAVTNLMVSRVSIWKMADNGNKIIRQYLYETNGGTDEKIDLTSDLFPAYFNALNARNFISANNAHTHPDTSEFSEVYLTPLQINSMLDCPILIDKDVYGVICCEHQNEFKTWNSEDQLFIQSLAGFIALNIKSKQISKLLETVKTQNSELTDKNIEIDQINANLEKLVEERTKKLEEQNSTLKEYAFVNSHLLRTPVSQIQGTLNLLKLQVDKLEDPILLNHLEKSTTNLDQIVQNISEMLNDGSIFSREEINKFSDKGN